MLSVIMVSNLWILIISNMTLNLIYISNRKSNRKMVANLKQSGRFFMVDSLMNACLFQPNKKSFYRLFKIFRKNKKF